MAACQVEALRKAYADVMLNMAQESAARVLAAERRSAALAAAKDDGVAALVRLKAIMDDRIKGEELRSLQHVKKIKELEEQVQSLQHVKIKELEGQVQSLQHVKIKELEDQLSGAQNSVATLQFELQRANTEIEKTRRILAEERINCFPTSKNMDSNKSISSRSKMNLQSRSMSLKNKKAAEDACLAPVIKEKNGAAQNMQNIYRRSSDLPSLTERNKKPKLYHSGCTQRIHALKQRNTDACQEQNHKHGTRLNSRSKGRKNAAAKNTCHTSSVLEQLLQTKFLGKFKRKRGSRSRHYNHDSSSEIREAKYKLSDASEGNGCLLLLRALEQDLSPLKVSAAHGGEALTDLKDDSLMKKGDAGLNQCTASPELIDILAAKHAMVKRRKRTKPISVLEVEFSDSKSVSESGSTLLRSTSEKSMSDTLLIPERKENDSDTTPGNNGLVLQHTTGNLMHQYDANSGQLETENSSAALLQSSKSEVIDYGSMLVQQPEHKTPDNTTSCKEVNGEGSCSSASEKADASTVTSLEKDEKFKAASSGLPMQASEKPDASVGCSLYKKEDADTSSGASMQADGVRHIKYTFNRRKHKYVSLNSTPPCAIPDKGSDLLSAPKEGEPHPNAEPQVNLIDSTQGDNQLVQVAQQLIFLSEHV